VQKHCRRKRHVVVVVGREGEREGMWSSRCIAGRGRKRGTQWHRPLLTVSPLRFREMTLPVAAIHAEYRRCGAMHTNRKSIALGEKHTGCA
jgi:hypothetical protein